MLDNLYVVHGLSRLVAYCHGELGVDLEDIHHDVQVSRGGGGGAGEGVSAILIFLESSGNLTESTHIGFEEGAGT